MKNETIEILASGEHLMPIGTKVTDYDKNGKVCEFTVDKHLYIKVVDDYHSQVDFSEVEPLYPHKGMEVPEEGIPFVDGEGKLLDVGVYGLTYSWKGNIIYQNYEDKYHQSYELKLTLPKTVTVCKHCFKEVCECKRESGFYRIAIGDYWTIRYYDKSNNAFYHSDGICESLKWGENDGQTHKVDWNNPINVTPESEV